MPWKEMMKIIQILACLAMLAAYGCGNSDSVCSKNDRHGTYTEDSEVISREEIIEGLCPPDIEPITRLENIETWEEECTVDLEKWSDDECKLEREVTCTDSEGMLAFFYNQVSVQENDDGSQITGTIKIDIYYIAGSDDFHCPKGAIKAR